MSYPLKNFQLTFKILFHLQSAESIAMYKE